MEWDAHSLEHVVHVTTNLRLTSASDNYILVLRMEGVWKETSSSTYIEQYNTPAAQTSTPIPMLD